MPLSGTGALPIAFPGPCTVSLARTAPSGDLAAAGFSTSPLSMPSSAEIRSPVAFFQCSLSFAASSVTSSAPSRARLIFT